MRKEQAAQTGVELKAAAVRAFARLGYLNTKITDITAEAGRAAGSFYTHFANKEALLEALLADLLAETDADVLAAPGHSDDFRDRGAVRWHVASYWGFFRRHRTVMVALQQAAAVDEAFARRSQAMTEPDLRHIADHLAGLPLTSDPLTTARMVTTLLQGFIATWEGGDEVVDTLTDFVYAAIGGKD
ncbi:TetR/AcrR family transcriptional regulator [Actinoplanes sp. NPDC049265]|uniref:TetR/AcrR family transcriptional regulator n=1 Tax=Actinoplanes sp. NPDC049265 TaxID=3363902 RepID=UPI00371EC7D3